MAAHSESGAENCPPLHQVAGCEDSGAEKHSFLHRTGLAADFGAKYRPIWHQVAEKGIGMEKRGDFGAGKRNINNLSGC